MVAPYINKQREWHEENLNGKIARYKNFNNPTRNDKSKKDFFYVLCKDHEQLLTFTRNFEGTAKTNIWRKWRTKYTKHKCSVLANTINASKDLRRWINGERLLSDRFWYYLEKGNYIGNIKFPEKHKMIETPYGYYCHIKFTAKILEHIYRLHNKGECLIKAFKKFYYNSFDESILETPK